MTRARLVALLAAADVVALLVAGGCAPDAPADERAPPGWAITDRALRPDSPRTMELFRYDVGDRVESLASPSGEFRVHYTRAGDNAVPAADADGSGVPDTVERVALLYDEALAYYRSVGFRAPPTDRDILDNGGDAAFDVYLLDFGGSADGSYRREACRRDRPAICSGYMVQENDFAGYGYPSVVAAERIVGSHELFHAVQAAYDADQGSLLSEGTAVWATEQFDASLGDFESLIRGYFANTDRSLDKPLPGPVDPFSYGSAIFFRHLSEVHGEATIRELLEATEDGAGGVADPQWYTLLPGFLEARGSSFAETFTTFVAWNTFTGGSASTGYGYARARDYPGFMRTAVQAPVEEVALRVFYASAQGFTIGHGGRARLEVALAADDLEGMVLLTAPVVGGRVQAPPREARDPWQAGYDTAGVDAVVAVLINTNTAGNSKRPTLCAGDADEVRACLARNGGPVVDGGVEADSGAEADSGEADTGAGADAGVITPADAGGAPDASAPAVIEESSCATTRGGELSAALVLVAMWMARRTRRHARSSGAR